VKGEHDQSSDYALRPAWDDNWQRGKEAEALFDTIAQFARVRSSSRALQHGGYRELLVSAEQFAFLRESEGERIIVAVNAASTVKDVCIPQRALQMPPLVWRDLLSGEEFRSHHSGLSLNLHPSWLRIMRAEG